MKTITSLFFSLFAMIVHDQVGTGINFHNSTFNIRRSISFNTRLVSSVNHSLSKYNKITFTGTAAMVTPTGKKARYLNHLFVTIQSV